MLGVWKVGVIDVAHKLLDHWCKRLIFAICAACAIGFSVVLGFGIAVSLPVWAIISAFVPAMAFAAWTAYFAIIIIISTFFYCLYKLILNIWVYITLKTQPAAPAPEAALA